MLQRELSYQLPPLHHRSPNPEKPHDRPPATTEQAAQESLYQISKQEDPQSAPDLILQHFSKAHLVPRKAERISLPLRQTALPQPRPKPRVPERWSMELLPHARDSILNTTSYLVLGQSGKKEEGNGSKEQWGKAGYETINRKAKFLFRTRNRSKRSEHSRAEEFRESFYCSKLSPPKLL